MPSQMANAAWHIFAFLLSIKNKYIIIIILTKIKIDHKKPLSLKTERRNVHNCYNVIQLSRWKKIGKLKKKSQD